MYERPVLSRLLQTRRSVLLLDPRQVGKSTLLACLNPDLSINLASPAVFRDGVSQPERLDLEPIAAGPQIRTVLIDETQRVPTLLHVLQTVVDEPPWPLPLLVVRFPRQKTSSDTPAKR